MTADENERDKTLSSSEDRIRVFIDTVLEDDDLSEEAQSILKSLKETDRDLANIDVNELGDLLLEGHP